MSNEDNNQQQRQGGFLSRLFGGGGASEAQAPIEEGPTLADVDKQLKRFAKEIYRSSALAEDASNKHQETLATLKEQFDAQTATQAEASAKKAQDARLELAEALLPVVDAVEAGIATGKQQIEELQDMSPAAARILDGWLAGQRLLRERVLRLLADEGVTPMQPIGELFDPYRHVAVKAVHQAQQPTNTVVAVERAGYVQGEAVLRFAEVVVNQVSQQGAEAVTSTQASNAEHEGTPDV
jgi:molecular chaperone GrpE